MIISCEVFAAKLLNLIKHEYREPCLKRCCDVIDDVINMKDDVLYYIWVKESESAIRLKLSWKLMNMKKCPNFRPRRTFKPEVIPEVDIVIKLALD